MAELNHLMSTARMIIGIVEARMGYSAKESKAAVTYEGIGGQDPEVYWTEPRNIDPSKSKGKGTFCVLVSVNYQAPDLYAGSWTNAGQPLLTVTLNGYDFFLRPNGVSGTWECADGDGLERPLNPKLKELVEECALRRLQCRATTGELVTIILDFLTWRETQ